MIILNESKIKYDHLNEILQDRLIDIKLSNLVNIVVDLKEIIKKFFRPDILNTIPDKRLLAEEISSDIINTIGHYRNYFIKKNKFTRFIFLYSFDKCAKIQDMIPDYKEYYYAKYFDNTSDQEKIILIKKVCEICKNIINRIPNSRFIDSSKCDEFVTAKYFIEHTEESQLNVILSNDEIMYQLLNSHTILLNLKGIKSQMVTDKNAMSILTEKETELSSNMIPFLVAFGGNEKYSLKSIQKVALVKALNIIEYLVNNGIISDQEYVEFPLKKGNLNLKNKSEQLIYSNFDTIKRNYEIARADSILYSNIDYLKSLYDVKLAKGSKDYFLNLNAKIFNSYPLMLGMLLIGEKI